MPITYKFEPIEDDPNRAAFDGVTVDIPNPFEIIEPEIYGSLETFTLKKQAIAFCKNHNVSYSRIVKIRTRFQYGWIIDLGRNSFVPKHAMGYVIAHAMGYEFVGVE